MTTGRRPEVLGCTGNRPAAVKDRVVGHCLVKHEEAGYHCHCR